jgi:hypothetical protein
MFREHLKYSTVGTSGEADVFGQSQKLFIHIGSGPIKLREIVTAGVYFVLLFGFEIICI